MASKFITIEAYINSQPTNTQKTLRALKKIIKKAAPDADEIINYNIPAYAFIKGGKRDKQVMIAGYKTFVGFYPGANILNHFEKELAGYTAGKASVQFPNNKPLPEKLIIKIVQIRKKQILNADKK